MRLKNSELDTLIKIRELISANADTLLTNEENKNNFLNFLSLISKALKDKKKVSQRSYQYNLEHKEYNRITVNMAKAKKYKNPEKYEYWRHQFEEYKKRREVK